MEDRKGEGEGVTKEELEDDSEAFKLLLPPGETLVKSELEGSRVTPGVVVPREKVAPGEIVFAMGEGDTESLPLSLWEALDFEDLVGARTELVEEADVVRVRVTGGDADERGVEEGELVETGVTDGVTEREGEGVKVPKAVGSPEVDESCDDVGGPEPVPETKEEDVAERLGEPWVLKETVWLPNGVGLVDCE